MLDQQIEEARKEIASDGYDMSVGELLNLYRDKELIIHPEFQRLFRWTELQKTRFIESLLLGIPVPPIFVFQDQSGAWELIDGLQRLSTIFEFVGVLQQPEGETSRDDNKEDDEHEEEAEAHSALLGTNFLPALEGKVWEAFDDFQGIGKSAQLAIKRARLRVEILKKESDPVAKYELFQRLNTGGTSLTEQEVRNCTALMINPKFQRWMTRLSDNIDFKATTALTREALRKQAGVELVLRFTSFRNVPYKPGLDVHEYLDKSLLEIAGNNSFHLEDERSVFERTFAVLNSTLGENAFKRWDGQRFTGKFLMSLFEVIALGVSKNIEAIEKLKKPKVYLERKAQVIWENKIFIQNSGAGVRGTTRLAKLLPLAGEFFEP